MKSKVNWADLSKKLQEALSKEMKESEMKDDCIRKLNNRIEELESTVDVFDGDNIRMSNELKGKQAIITYLERRLYTEMKRVEDKEWEVPF
jgi:predicted RNase H-like nuclease (RuvC/YqgF family)